jgi:hypothetical protein
VVSPNLAPSLAEALGDREHAVRRHVPLVGTAEDDRDHALATQALPLCAGERAANPLQRFGDRSVDVAAVVGLGGRQEDVHLIEAIALPQGAFEAAFVGDQHRVGDAVRPGDRGEHLLGVGKLGDDVGPYERCHLEPAQSRGREEVDQSHLLRGRDDLGLVLEAVARPDLADLDALGQLTHGAELMPCAPPSWIERPIAA